MAQTPQSTSATAAFWQLLNDVPNLGKWKIAPAERAYRLERMRLLLERFERPHLACQTIHVAGTKGKGSTATFLAAAFQAAGYRTGLYVSPHVSDPVERISVALAAPAAGVIAELVAQIRAVIETLPAAALPGGFPFTAFELLTLLAFLYFRATACEFAVIEAGIGGRLDATNVIQPAACLLTPLDLEHIDVLGDTLADIAREKSGIIKPGVPVFCGFQPPEVKRIFQEASVAQAAPIRFLDEELETLAVNLSPAGTAFTVKFKGLAERTFKLKLLGEFQAENAALAYLASRRMLPQINAETLVNGIANAFLPGRMELIQATPPVMLDGAHTPLAAQRLWDSFRRLFPQPGILIFGAVAGKNIAAMADILAPGFREIIISTPGSFKDSDPAGVYHIFEQRHPCVRLVKDPAAALQTAVQAAHQELPILVTGSFFMVAEIRRFF